MMKSYQNFPNCASRFMRSPPPVIHWLDARVPRGATTLKRTVHISIHDDPHATTTSPPPCRIDSIARLDTGRPRPATITSKPPRVSPTRHPADLFFFFFNNPAPPEISSFPLPAALPI